MKLLLIAPCPPPYGGISNWSKIVIDGIRRYFADIDLDVIDISPRRRETEGRNLFNRAMDGITSTIKALCIAKKTLKNSKPDSVHLTTSGSLALLRDYVLLIFFRKHQINTVYHIHFGRTAEIIKYGSWERILLMHAMKHAGSVIILDRLSFNSLREQFPLLQVKKINNPIKIMGEPRNSTSKYYMFLGWVLKTKGIEELVSAWNQAGINATLRIVGPYQESYLEYLHQAGYDFKSIIFEGEKGHDEAMEILSECEAFILPSYSEGCPYVILEAMSFKKPIIATNVGDIPNMLSNECGILVEPHSSTQICEAIKSLESDSDLKIRIGSNAYKRVLEEYSIKEILDLYRNEWESKYESIPFLLNVS